YTYENGEKHLLWGKEYSLEVVYTKGKPCASVQGEQILLELPKDGDTALRQKLIENLYRRQLKAKVPLLMEKYTKIVGKVPDSWGVKNMKTRWGTCNVTDKRIWLNLQLAKFPQECLEYVIVHELVHLYEKGHNAVFYGYMDRFYPGWREIRKKLKG
ncbi:MAG: M48 family metallopeptidase, partial [Lachnospiraceae bacterium]|nr:M48 family metallopeptidase [Lachnospiraceae bacterium]